MTGIVNEADVIVCGGGGAGCCIAARLAEARPDLEILLLEQGGDNREVARLTNPLDSLFWLFDQNPHLRWLECEPQIQLNGRQPRIPIANLLGGGTSINTLMYNTPAASDFDDWGQPGWSFKELEPFIAKTIRFDIPTSKPPHGLVGPVDVSYGGHTMDWGEEVRSAVQGAIPDINQMDYITTYTPSAGHSVGRQPKLISSRGIRSNTAHAYIHSSKSSNLRVLTHIQITRILLDHGTATGVEVVNLADLVGGGNQMQEIRARRQVVLCCGTLGSPCVLERSGVGDLDVLKAAGVEAQVDLPGVGAELDDHQLTWGTYHSARDDGHDDYARGVREIRNRVDREWEKTGQGIAGSNGFDWGYKVRPNQEEIKTMGPEFERYWEAVGAHKPDKPLYSFVAIPYFYSFTPRPETGNYFCLAGFHNYPASRGWIHITSFDPNSPPRVHAGLLEDPVDLPVHVWHYKVQREIARRLPFYRGEVIAAHPKFSSTSAARFVDPSAPYISPTDRIQYSEEDDKAIAEWVKDIVATAYHSISTCPMRERAKGGVVSPRLDVFGTKRLKVADLSIVPKNVGANTTSIVLLVAERAVEIILEDLATILNT